MTQLQAAFPIVEDDDTMTTAFRDEMNRLSRAVPLTGTGSPEAVVSGLQFQTYIDQTGTAGSILYVKRDTDIGGDTTKGWILV